MGLELTPLPRRAAMQLCAAPRLSGSLRCPGMGLAEEAGIPPDTPATDGHPQPGLLSGSREKGLSQRPARPHPWDLRGDTPPPFSLSRAPLPPHPVVLVGGHGREARLLEDEGFEVLLRVFLAVFPGVHVDHVKTRLVSVHGVQNDLNDKTSKETITDPGGASREESAAPGPAGSLARGQPRGWGRPGPRSPWGGARAGAPHGNHGAGSSPPGQPRARHLFPGDTYMPVVIQQIVGQFELIERNDLLHPLRPFRRGVRVVMHPPGGGGVGFAGHQPGGAVEGVPEGGEGTLSRSPGAPATVPPQRFPAAPQDPARVDAPGPGRGKRRLPPQSHFLRQQEERALLHSQRRCGGKIISYQVPDGTGGREICRAEKMHSYLRRFGREATKAPLKKRVEGSPLYSNVLALSEEWKVSYV